MSGFSAAKGRVVLLIPALDPDEHLLELLEQMKPIWNGPVILVDDGSSREAKERIFPAAKAMGCVVVHHEQNRGKGRALKTGFEECLRRWPDLVGVVTADADGQHLPEDIRAVEERLLESPDALVLGCRDFGASDVPSKSMLGNRITRTFMRFFCGVGVTDTQTGLRGIPAGFMKELLLVNGEGFDFETNMLLETKTCRVAIIEQPIHTVYLQQNRASHFQPLQDSVRIYTILLKFCAASLAGFCVDIAAFAVLSGLFSSFGKMAITAATVLARILSAGVNYLLNQKLVFKSRKQMESSAVRYGVLCVAQMLASAGLVTLIHELTLLPAVEIKIVVDSLLFFVSFQIQRRWVF